MNKQTINSIGTVFNSHNTRHWSLSWPAGTTLAQLEEEVMVGKVLDRFREKLAQAMNVAESKLAIFGFLMSEPHFHAHVLVRASRSAINIPKAVVREVEEFWFEMAGNTAECTAAFNPPQWADYITGFHNIRKPGQRWLQLPTHNEQMLNKKRIQAQRKGKNV